MDKKGWWNEELDKELLTEVKFLNIRRIVAMAVFPTREGAKIMAVLETENNDEIFCLAPVCGVLPDQDQILIRQKIYENLNSSENFIDSVFKMMLLRKNFLFTEHESEK